MKPPAHAPAWAEPLGLRLVEAGFVETDEGTGGMACYIVSHSLGDLTVSMGSDRGQWGIDVHAPNPVRGRGRPRAVTAEVELYRAALRHDETTDALVEDIELRAEKSAAWLEDNLDVLVRTYHDADVWNEVKELQRARAKRLFPLPTSSADPPDVALNRTQTCLLG